MMLIEKIFIVTIYYTTKKILLIMLIVSLTFLSTLFDKQPSKVDKYLFILVI